MHFIQKFNPFSKLQKANHWNSSISKAAHAPAATRGLNLPVQLLQRHRDLEVVSQHVQRREDVGPLHHLAQRTPLQHLGTEDVPGLLGEEAHMNQNLKSKKKEKVEPQSKVMPSKFDVCVFLASFFHPWLHWAEQTIIFTFKFKTICE